MIPLKTDLLVNSCRRRSGVVPPTMYWLLHQQNDTLTLTYITSKRVVGFLLFPQCRSNVGVCVVACAWVTTTLTLRHYFDVEYVALFSIFTEMRQHCNLIFLIYIKLFSQVIHSNTAFLCLSVLSLNMVYSPSHCLCLCACAGVHKICFFTCTIYLKSDFLFPFRYLEPLLTNLISHFMNFIDAT